MSSLRSILTRLISMLTLALLALVTADCNGDEPAPDTLLSKDSAGAWYGSFKVGDVSVRLVINLTQKSDGTWAGTLDAPDAGKRRIQIDEVVIEGDAVSMKLNGIPASFEGKLSNDGAEASGTWTQAGQSFMATFRRLANPPETALRPQEPKKPYPYSEEVVFFDDTKVPLRLAGTLTLPKGDGPFLSVLLVSGSGPQDRDETLFGHRPFLVLADYLTRKGVAVLRLDDRGTGKSTGEFNKATIEDFTEDVLAALEYLKGRKEIDAKRTGLLGHSEGATVASLVASRSDNVAFVVMLAGPGVNGEELWSSQSAQVLKVAGATEEQVKRYQQVQQELIAIILREPDNKSAARELRRVLDSQFQNLSVEELKVAGNVGALADAQIKNMLSPAFRCNLAYDPRPTLMKVRCPVLAINGEKDIVVACAENLARIEEALTGRGQHAAYGQGAAQSQSLTPDVRYWLARRVRDDRGNACPRGPGIDRRLDSGVHQALVRTNETALQERRAVILRSVSE